MTREEAIAVLRREIEPSVYEDEKSIAEAIDMAIEALSVEEAVWNEYEAEFTDLPDIPRYYYEKVVGKMAHEINMLREQLESADAVMRDATAEERASVQRYIDSISTEAVQVVRCKDCRWWNGSQETMHNNHLCRNWSKFGSINTSADDYCSWGERR